MTKEEAIRILDHASTLDVMVDYPDISLWVKACNEASRMGAAALRDQQTTLDRSRWEGCEWCKSIGKSSESFELGDIWAIRGVTYTHYGDGEMHYMSERFCPICGRPLTEEAWTELERKIGGNDGKDDMET